MEQNANPQRAFTWKTFLLIALILAGVTTLLISLRPRVRYSINTVVRRQINALDKGAELYRKEYGLYPGQLLLDRLISEGGKYTGSEVLAMAVYGADLTGQGPKRPPQDVLLPFKAEHITWNYSGHPHTLSDGQPGKEAMAICYYVPRPGKDGEDRFVEADNAVYTDQARGGDFRTFISRPRYGGGKPYMRDFLLIAPRGDRKYFTDDDIANF